MRALLIFICLAVCGITLALVTAQRRELGRSREQEQQLRVQAAASVAPVAPPSEATPATPKQQSPSTELLRLRGEVGQLERRKREFSSTQSENKTLRTQLAAKGTNAPGAFVLPAGYIKKSEAKFAGYGTPEDTIQSLLWAIQNENTTQLLQAFDSEFSRHLETEIQRRGSPEEFFKDTKAMPGLRIIGKQTEPDGAAVLTVEILPGDEIHTEKMRLKQFDGQWKLLSGF